MLNMFNIFKKDLSLYCPIAGRVIDLKEVPDQIFSEKMVGDGVAIDSIGDTVYAPQDGEIVSIFPTNHAFSMVLNNGVELLVHIGIDTVKLNGEGLERLIEPGTKVARGTPIIKVDRELILKKGVSLITPIVITNADVIKNMKCKVGENVSKSNDIILTYKLK